MVGVGVLAVGFTVAASFAPSPGALAGLEIAVGFGVGGSLPVCYTLFVEFIPKVCSLASSRRLLTYAETTRVFAGAPCYSLVAR